MNIGAVAWVSLLILYFSPLFDYLLWPFIEKRIEKHKRKKER